MKATIFSVIAVGLLMCNIQAAHGIEFSVPPKLSLQLMRSALSRQSLRAAGSGVGGTMMCGTQCSYMAGVLTCSGECTQPELDAIKDYYENKQSKDTKSSTVQSGPPSTVQPE